jgi:hypothetical protein
MLLPLRCRNWKGHKNDQSDDFRMIDNFTLTHNEFKTLTQ